MGLILVGWLVGWLVGFVHAVDDDANKDDNCF